MEAIRTRNASLPMLVAALALCAAGQSGAQQTAEALPAGPVLAKVVTASLEERVAAARSVKVMDSILGIKLGSELDEAHEKLDPLCAPGILPKTEGGGEEEERRDEKAGKTDDKMLITTGSCVAMEPKVKPAADEEEGRKVLWQLGGTDYLAVYVTADDKERLTSITGILRPGKEVPFDQVGEVAKAPVHDSHAAVWDVLRLGQPLCRVLAKGAEGKAGTIMLSVIGQKSPANVSRRDEKDEGKAD